MMRLIQFFIRKPKLVNLLMVFILLSGLMTMKFKLNVEGYPPVDFGVMTVVTPYPGMSPEDVELRVTNKIEEQLKSVSGIDEMMSSSMEGFSYITVRIDESVDADKVKSDVREAVNNASGLPVNLPSKPIVSEVNNMDLIPIQELALVGDAPLALKRRYALALEKRLLVHSGIGKVNKLGYRDREVHISLQQDQLRRHYLSLLEVKQAMESHHIRLTAGDMPSLSGEKKLVLMSEPKDLKAIRDIVIRSGFDGGTVRLGDVATVSYDYAPATLLSLVNGQDCIQLLILKKEGSDIMEASAVIDDLADRFREELPPEVQLVQLVDYTIEVDALLDLVLDNAALGLFLVLVALVVILNFRVALWTAMGIPISILFGFIFMPFFWDQF